MKCKVRIPAEAWYLLGAFLVAGFGLYWLYMTEHQIRDRMLVDLGHANDLIVAAVEPDRFHGLSMTEENNQGPDYIRLRQQFISMHQVIENQIDTIGHYAMGVVGDEVRFLVDSAEESDPWHSLPGTVYQYPTEDVLSVIADGRPVAGGPYTDEYGTFYTAVAPLYDRHGGVAAYIGTDIYADVFDEKVRGALTAPRLKVVAVFLAYSVLFLAAERLLAARRRRDEQLRAAIESDRAKTDFIDVAIHQLKTPLTALKWSVEMLEGIRPKAKWSDSEEEVFRQAVDATRRLDELVAALLNIDRLESGHLKVEPRPTDLRALAVDVLDELRVSVEQKKHEVSVDMAAGTPEADIDSAMVREVFKNLLTNAIKYTPSGGKIGVAAKVDGMSVVCSVKDSGIGIPKGEQGHVFDKFYRASNVEGQPDGGTGLGLYFAKQAVELSGGKMWFDSTEGSGSTFYFSLPIADGKKMKVGRSG